MSEMPKIGEYGCFVKDPDLTTWLCDIENLGTCAVNFTIQNPEELSKGWIQGPILKVIAKQIVTKTDLATVSHYEHI